MLRELAGKVVYHPDLTAPRGAGRIAVRANQFLFEHGITPPWVWSATECREFWAKTTEESGNGNEPSSYSQKNRSIVGTMVDFWSPEVTTESSVLEIGCNAGANLKGLHERGFRDLSAAEINPAAIEELHRAFPELDPMIHLGPVEDTLAAIPGNSVDVVFSMAVLIHVHPASRQVFAEMARIARQHVCVVEAEWPTLPYIFARNYRRVFEGVGCRHLRAMTITAEHSPEVGSDYWGYAARLFRAPRPSSPSAYPDTVVSRLR
jgi:SAM-dependent methyltransferase